MSGANVSGERKEKALTSEPHECHTWGSSSPSPSDWRLSWGEKKSDDFLPRTEDKGDNERGKVRTRSTEGAFSVENVSKDFSTGNEEKKGAKEREEDLKKEGMNGCTRIAMSAKMVQLGVQRPGFTSLRCESHDSSSQHLWTIFCSRWNTRTHDACFL